LSAHGVNNDNMIANNHDKQGGPVQDKSKPGEDLTGRSEMAKNVLASWIGYTVFVVIGFVLPRAIDQEVGRTALGIWDFGWSVVSYFGLAELGIGTSLNHFTAKYRAEHNDVGISKAASSAMVIQVFAALIVVAFTLVAAWYVPSVFGARFGELTTEAQLVVLFLGLSIAVEMALQSFTGILTGMHRWDVHNGLNVGFHFGAAVAMIAALHFGGGLFEMSVAYFVFVCLRDLTRAIIVFRICPQLRLKFEFVERQQIRQCLSFGIRGTIEGLSMLLLFQSTQLLIAYAFGAAALATFARPLALARHVGTFVNKFSNILTPTVSAMLKGTDKSELGKMFIRYSAISTYFTLPPILFLIFFGNTVILVWMGPEYQNLELIVTLAAGHVFFIACSTEVSFLMGMNRHGPIAVASLIGAIVAVALMWLVVLQADATMLDLATILAGCLWVVYGLYVPWYGSRVVGVPLARYLMRSWVTPTLTLWPYVLFLYICSITFEDQSIQQLLLASLGSVIILGFIFWVHVIPENIRDRIRPKFVASPV
jgi:O-antigen/teichoic acid export membrane protein